ncbi:thioredoxin family protein [Acinetobacter bohemicus]|uniref:thioredoxin family protein n=1 Tax=Acinetobacter TaxID=469 RepID=UPI00209BA4F9|nr:MULTISPECIES: thioredoxin family protein [Acinetobacter]MCO8041976.1 thioredoxin family protein [Acinetobacter sp. S4400-12]MCO8044547.1 thioredoxin family protein [Acinetobacter sp. S4397-1]MCU7224640.1 thioredoxin family protein [Acinetobacter bohemicus]
MADIIEYTENNYTDFEWYDGLAIIRFYADWCAPCVQNAPVFEQWAKTQMHAEPNIKFGKVNIDQSPILTLRYQVYGLPSTLIFYQGNIIQRIAGVKSMTQMQSYLEQAKILIS